MEEEPGEIFNRHIDLVTRRAAGESRNYLRKKTILDTLEPVYVA